MRHQMMYAMPFCRESIVDSLDPLTFILMPYGWSASFFSNWEQATLLHLRNNFRLVIGSSLVCMDSLVGQVMFFYF